MDKSDAMRFVEEMLAEKPANVDEDPVRRRIVARLFHHFRAEGVSAESYLAETYAIPLDKLALAVLAIIRSRVYPTLPTCGDLWQAARNIAGLGREQYVAGRYVAGPREWPPIGRRHGINAGSFEALPLPERAVALLPPRGVATIEAGAR